jgi:hypothetical protein
MKSRVICQSWFTSSERPFKVNVFNDYTIGTKWFGSNPPLYSGVIYRIKVIPKVKPEGVDHDLYL